MNYNKVLAVFLLVLPVLLRSSQTERLTRDPFYINASKMQQDSQGTVNFFGESDDPQKDLVRAQYKRLHGDEDEFGQEHEVTKGSCCWGLFSCCFKKRIFLKESIDQA